MRLREAEPLKYDFSQMHREKSENALFAGCGRFCVKIALKDYLSRISMIC